jgi:hypothetical protein
MMEILKMSFTTISAITAAGLGFTDGFVRCYSHAINNAIHSNNAGGAGAALMLGLPSCSVVGMFEGIVAGAFGGFVGYNVAKQDLSPIKAAGLVTGVLGSAYYLAYFGEDGSFKDFMSDILFD